MTTTEDALARGAEAANCELTVLLPCLNEAETLGRCIRNAQQSIAGMRLSAEVLVADNGSSDGSQEIAQSAGATVVDVPVRGYGAALRAGIEAASGEYVIMADADDSYPLEDLQAFVEMLRSGADLVMGNRFRGGIQSGAMPALHRYLGNPVLSFLGRTFFNVPVKDFHCGMRGFRRKAILGLNLRASGMEFASEMVVKAAVNQLSIREVPTTLRPDGRSRKPHLRTWHDGWRHLRFLLVFSPRWLFFYPGLLLAMVGLAGMLWLLPGPHRVDGLRLDLQSMLFFALGLIVGVQGCLFYRTGQLAAVALGLLPDDTRTARMRNWSLERGVLIGGALTAVGLIGLGRSVLAWQAKSFGTLDVETSMRWAIASFTIVIVGMQLLLTSFLASVSQIEHS